MCSSTLVKTDEVVLRSDGYPNKGKLFSNIVNYGYLFIFLSSGLRKIYMQIVNASGDWPERDWRRGETEGTMFTFNLQSSLLLEIQMMWSSFRIVYPGRLRLDIRLKENI